MIGYCRRMDGFEISEEAIYYDEIEDVGPGGTFLMEDSTLENMREFYIPDALKPRKKGQKETLLDELSARAFGDKLLAWRNPVILDDYYAKNPVNNVFQDELYRYLRQKMA